MACVLMNLGAAYRFREALLPAGEGVEVSNELAFELFEKYPNGKIGDQKRFVLVSGTPMRPVPSGRRYLTRASARKALRLPEVPDLKIPAPVPEDVRKLMSGPNWQTAIPGVFEKCDPVRLALWLALSDKADRAEAVLAAAVGG